MNITHLNKGTLTSLCKRYKITETLYTYRNKQQLTPRNSQSTVCLKLVYGVLQCISQRQSVSIYISNQTKHN